MTYSSREDMTVTKDIVIAEIIQSDVAIDTADGDLVHDRIEEILSDRSAGNPKIRISFRGLKLITPSFLNSAIGALYEANSAQFLRESLSIVEAEPDDLARVKRVVERAQEYFKNPSLHDSIVESVMNED